MQANTTFQKVFFGIIFVVTALMFYQMYQTHQRNMAQKPCVARTRLLLDILTEEAVPDSLSGAARKIEISPGSDRILDSAVFLLNQWGKESHFSDYKPAPPNTNYTESIHVIYLPPFRGQDPMAPGFSQVALEIRWLLMSDSIWQAKLSFVSIPNSK